MRKTITLSRNSYTLLSILTPVVIISFSLAISFTEGFRQNNKILSKAVAIDLLVLMPSIYFFVARKSKLPMTSAAPIFILGVIAGSFILPEEHHSLLDYFSSYALPLVEADILFSILFKIVKTLKLYRSKQKSSSDFFYVLK